MKSQREAENVCLYERERERGERKCEQERERVCVCVCVRARERESEKQHTTHNKEIDPMRDQLFVVSQ